MVCSTAPSARFCFATPDSAPVSIGKGSAKMGALPSRGEADCSGWGTSCRTRSVSLPPAAGSLVVSGTLPVASRGAAIFCSWTRTNAASSGAVPSPPTAAIMSARNASAGPGLPEDACASAWRAASSAPAAPAPAADFSVTARGSMFSKLSMASHSTPASPDSLARAMSPS